MNVSDIHSDDAATGKGQSVREEEEAIVASTSHSHSLSPADVSGTSVDTVRKSEDIFANLSDSKKEKGIEILEVEEESEPCVIDLTTLLSPEEKTIEDDICITKVVHNKGPLAELMAKRKKNKKHKSESRKTPPSSTAGSPDIFLKDLVRRSREYAEKRTRSRSRSRHSSEKRHYSSISDALSEKQCCEQEVQIDENSNLGHWNRSESPSPSTTDERQCDNLPVSPTYKRKKEPHKELLGGYREGCYKKPTYSETATQPRGKRKKRSSVEEDVVIITDVSSSSEENSPCTSRRKKHKQTFTRGWEWSDFGVEHRKNRNEYPGLEFSIMSYNLLAQDLLELHPHLYTDIDCELLNWTYRRARLLEEIDQHLPDILCFQEVQCDHYEDFLTPKLEARGYLGIYCKKSGCQTDGCATFFNVMKFELLNFRQVFYQKGEVLDRANVGLIVGLQPKASAPNSDSNQLYVANTHLLFNPRRGDVKLAQLILFLAELDKAAFKCHKSSNKIVYHPTILCGDFNLEPFCRIYKLIVSRYMRYEGLLIRTLAGTSEYHYGRDYHLAKDFFPSYLDITNFCQFAETVKERNLKEATKLLKESSPTDPSSENAKKNPSDSAEPEDSRLSPASSNEISPPPGMEEMLTPLNSGEVSHFFNFVSTYEHEIRNRRHRRMEVTSYHNHACGTMDYIFYSVDKKPNKSHGSSVPEGRLKLLRRYQLFSTDEVKRMEKLPNAELGSDHFSLLAHFLLT